MIDYGSEAALLEFFPEALYLIRLQTAKLPAPRVPSEDLENITLLCYCCVYCVIEGFGDGDVDPDLDRKLSLISGRCCPVDRFGFAKQSVTLREEARSLLGFSLFFDVLLGPFMSTVLAFVGVLEFFDINDYRSTALLGK